MVHSESYSYMADASDGRGIQLTSWRPIVRVDGRMQPAVKGKYFGKAFGLTDFPDNSLGSFAYCSLNPPVHDIPLRTQRDFTPSSR